MATDLPISFRASPLPSNFKGTPQQLLDAMVARLAIQTEDQLALFVAGATAPTSDSGPWIKNGITWYVWDVGTGAYIPQVIEFESLRYIASQTAPDQNKYVFWIKLDVTGKAIGIYYYSGGAWKDVYEDALATITAAQNNYPFRGDSAGDQDIPLTGPDSTSVLLSLAETFDPDNVFTPGVGSSFIAPVNGYYQIDAKANLEVTSGSPTGNFLTIQLVKNSFGLNNDQAFWPVDDAALAGRTYPISTVLQLQAGDIIQAIVNVTVTAGTGTWTIKGNNTFLAGYKVKSA